MKIYNYEYRLKNSGKIIKKTMPLEKWESVQGYYKTIHNYVKAYCCEPFKITDNFITEVVA